MSIFNDDTTAWKFWAILASDPTVTMTVVNKWVEVSKNITTTCVTPSNVAQCGYFSMVLLGAPTEGGSWEITENGGIRNCKTTLESLNNIQSRWISLGVLAEQIKLDIDFGQYKDKVHSPEKVIELIKKRLVL